MKKIIDSYTEQVHIVNSSNINGYGRLFGGQLMQWIDETAAVVARRHSQKNVTTAAVDRLQFRKEARVNDTVVLRGYLTYVGNTSMEVKVKSYVEKLNGERVLINEAYVVMIAIDENEKPTSVPGLILTTDKEKEEWEQGKVRREERKRY